jgi:hypothetical protein
MKKKLCSVLIFSCLPLMSFAENYKYMSVFYNTTSVSDNLTDQQCQEIFKDPTFYNIKNDQAVYEKTKGPYQINSFTRISTTYLSKNQRLFYGKQNISLNINGKELTVDADVSYSLDLHRSTIRGSLYVPGYCKANIMGVKQNLHNWDNTQETNPPA